MVHAVQIRQRHTPHGDHTVEKAQGRQAACVQGPSQRSLPRGGSLGEHFDTTHG